LQTHLKHPKNAYIQYESRTYTAEELKETFKSEGFQTFLERSLELVEHAQKQVRRCSK
jgi:hypothetical protein